MRLDVFSDVVCPWCYLGAARLRDALDRVGGDDIDLRWRAFQLDPSASHPPRPLRPVLERRYGPGSFDAMAERLVGLGRAAGLDYRFDQALALNTADAHRLVAWSRHDRPELTTALVWRLFAAYFTDGDDVSDRAVLAGLAAEVGLDAAAATEMLAAGSFADQVAEDRRAAAELDITGVPTFVVDGRFALPGAQDVDRLVAIIERGRARAADAATSDRATRN